MSLRSDTATHTAQNMDKRVDAFLEGLAKNAQETLRWEKYVEDNRNALIHLNDFPKHLSVNVMVPIGSKALLPGKVSHTNEILVGHLQSYFSMCSAHQAKDIALKRIEMAEKHLKGLLRERELYQKNLETPLEEGAFRKGEECEIIEEYDEKKEELWREQHKTRVREAKLREKAQREATQERIKSETYDIIQGIEDAELMEDLDKELMNLEIDADADNMLKKLMSGEMKLPREKKRIAYAADGENPSVVGQKYNSESVAQTKVRESIPMAGAIKTTDAALPKSEESEIIEAYEENKERPWQKEHKSISMRSSMNTTDAATQTTESSATSDHKIGKLYMSSEYDDAIFMKEMKAIKEQADFLSLERQADFYDLHIEIANEKLASLSIKNEDDLKQRVDLICALGNLEELKDATIWDRERESDEDNSKKLQQKHQKGRRISFSNENQTLEFRRNECVSEMLPKSDRIVTINSPFSQADLPKRDIIKLDDAFGALTKCEPQLPTPPNTLDKRKMIQLKVERNLHHAESTKDKNLLDRILADSSPSHPPPLHITIKHSEQEAGQKISSKDSVDFVPGTPSDFYQIYLNSLENAASSVTPNPIPASTTLFTQSYEGEERVKVPLLRSAVREQAYEDPRAKYSRPAALHAIENPTANNKPEGGKYAKSILRNKAAVKNEIHRPIIGSSDDESPKKREKSPQHSKQKAALGKEKEEDCLSAYYKVMTDVVEKPDPLPAGDFIDTRAPKKRVSHFKQMRSKGDKQSDLKT